MTSLAERLEAVRREHFVGREREKRIFREALAAGDLPFAVFYLHGPGGIGKTSLLREFAAIAAQQGATVVRLDARDLDATPDSFLEAVRQQAGLEAGEEVATALAGRAERTVLLVDTAELLAPLNGWLRNLFLPQLPDNVLTVLAGRTPPSDRWRSDPGWQALMYVHALSGLNDAESRALLQRRRVPAGEHAAILDFAHGQPLALSLVADLFAQQPETQFRPEESPDLIRALLERLMQEAPGPEHRAALEACSQVRLLNEPLLAALLQVVDPYPVFTWLRDLSFIEAHERGLFPHDLAREALAADLRWRNPEREAELHARARAYYLARFQATDADLQRQVLADYIFLHRNNPAMRTFFAWQAAGSLFTDAYRPEDRAAVLAMVRQHEGETAVRLAEHWLAHRPEAVTVFRQAGNDVQGFLLLLALEQTSPAERELDPAVAASWGYLEGHAPLAAGETATLCRCWMARDDYQGVSAVQSHIFLNLVQHYLTTPALVFSFLPCADPDFWDTTFTFADLQRLPQAGFTVDGRRYAVFGHDWRATPPFAWLKLMAERELGTGRHTLPPELPQLPAVFALDEESFTAAVREALRHYADPLALHESPLLHTRLLGGEARPDSPLPQRVQALQKLLAEQAATLQANPRQAKWYRALYHTYIQPAPTQERAAELLDLPFSTYRRHLRAGIEQVARLLWAREQGF